MAWRDNRLKPPSPCPHCGTVLNGVASPDGLVPWPGDLTICVECGAVAIFDDDLALRELTPAEWDEAVKDETLTEMLHALAHAKREAAKAKK